MKVIAQRVWSEPAVFIGLVTTLALLIGAVLTGSDWSLSSIVAISAPLLSSLGIRQSVTPVHQKDPVK